MAIMDIKGFNHDIIKDKLKTMGKDTYKLITYVNYLNDKCIKDLIRELNSKLNSPVGNRAYPSRNVVDYIYVLF